MPGATDRKSGEIQRLEHGNSVVARLLASKTIPFRTAVTAKTNACPEREAAAPMGATDA